MRNTPMATNWKKGLSQGTPKKAKKLIQKSQAQNKTFTL